MTDIYYDPLYEVVVFANKSEPDGERGYYYGDYAIGIPDDQEVTAQKFVEFVNSYEFNRLNFLRQAGLAWLVFPSATHTRFAHSLGCWLLSEWACENVFVFQSLEPYAPSSEKGSRKLVPEKLGKRLRDSKWIEEFQLSLLLHDVGHFPFSHVLENNDVLQTRYSEQDKTAGIRLDHEAIGASLVLGDNPAAELFKEYMRKQIGQDLDDRRFLSSILKNFRETVSLDKLIYLLLGDDSEPPVGMNPRDTRFVRGVKELVSGVIDLDRIDHYHRDSHFVSIRAGEFNVHGLLTNMALVDNRDSSRTLVQLSGDGENHAFQMLFAKKTLTDTVFHNPNNLAYEIMMNRAINLHWNKAGEDFRIFLPFYDDSQLIHCLAASPDYEAKRLAQRIRFRDPFKCAGKFTLTDAVYGELGSASDVRRSELLSRFEQQLTIQAALDSKCFLRLDSNFGKADKDAEWMDLSRVLGNNGKPLAKIADHANFIEFIHRHDSLRARTFWVFVSDESLLGDAEVLGQVLAEGRAAATPD